jgi:hypothetical protein
MVRKCRNFFNIKMGDAVIHLGVLSDESSRMLPTPERKNLEKKSRPCVSENMWFMLANLRKERSFLGKRILINSEYKCIHSCRLRMHPLVMELLFPLIWKEVLNNK